MEYWLSVIRIFFTQVIPPLLSDLKPKTQDQ